MIQLGKNNIAKVIDNALCTACGACSGICPHKSIAMLENNAGFLCAYIDENKCNKCDGMCYAICPSIPSNTPELNSFDLFHGNFLSGYIGHSTDKKIRQQSQSGGVVTALLCYLLEKGRVEGAIVNTFNKKNSRPKAVLAKNKNDIIEGCGSYYSQSSVVETVLQNQDKKTAAVVLGCQAESLKHIKKKYSKIQLPDYTIGLFCSGQYSGFFIEQLIKKAGLAKKEVTKFRFKDKSAGGWPGHTKVYSENTNKVIADAARHRYKELYKSYRCLLCFDQMNIYSDISVGDPWGIDKKDNKAGNTVIIVRTKKGEMLIKDAIEDGVISAEPLSVKRITEGQTVDNRLKPSFFFASEFCKRKGYNMPYEEGVFKKHSIKELAKKEAKVFKKRLVYSRNLYLKKNARSVNQLLFRKKSIVLVKRVFRKLAKIALRPFRKMNKV